MTSEQQQLARYFGPADGIRISNTPPNGVDRLNDMADAWLDGDLELYEKLRMEHERRLATREPIVQVRARTRSRPGRPRLADYVLIRQLRAQGMSDRAIAALIGCSKGAIWRATSLT